MKRPDRAGKVGFQLAALVDLLFVISFLLIWDREVLMQKRLRKMKAATHAAQADTRTHADVQKATLEALAQAEKAKHEAQLEVRRLAEQLATVRFDREREKKLERDLHDQYEWMLEGMRKGKDVAVIAPAQRGAPGSTAPSEPTSGPARR